MILVGSVTTTLVATWIHNRFKKEAPKKEVDIVITNADKNTTLAVHNDEHLLSLPITVTMSEAGRFVFTLPFSVRIFDANKATIASTPLIWSADTVLYRNTPFSLVHVIYNSDTGVAAALIDNAQPLVDGDGQLQNVSLECNLIMHFPHVTIRRVKIITEIK